MAPTPALIAVVTAVLAVTGCTSTVSPPSSSPPVTPTQTSSSFPPSASVTPTPPWSRDQAAAIAAVDGYRAAGEQIGTAPGDFTEAQMQALLAKWAGPAVVKANVASYLDLKKRGFRFVGVTSVVTTNATPATDVGYGTQVVITRCIDQRAARVVDSAGAEVSETELGYPIPEFLLRDYTAQKRTGEKSYRIFGLGSAKGQCGA